MRHFFRLSLLISFLLMMMVSPVWSQSKLAYVFLISKPDPDPGINQTYVKAMFTESLAALPSSGDIEIKTKPANAAAFRDTPLTISKVEFQGGNHAVLFIHYVYDPARSDDTEVQVTFKKGLTFNSGAVANAIAGSGNVYTKKTTAKLEEQATQRLKQAASSVKTSEEKNIFAGFSAAAPSSGGGGAQGNGEVNINRWVSPDFFLSMNVKKSSAEKADPKQFNIGLTYRKAFLFLGGAAKNAINAINAFQKNPGDDTHDAMLKALDDIRGKTFLGLLLDASGRIEGEALNFNVTNAIFDMPLQISSRTKNIGSGEAYFNFRIIPAGVELGRNLHSENNTMQKYYIGRFKYGGALSFVYAPENQETAFPKRVELSLQAVDRYLWRKETAFDQTTGKASGISRGHKPWYEMDLKVYLGESEQGRFGFRVSRIRGMLPPTFSDTRAYTFGAIFESAEDKKQQ